MLCYFSLFYLLPDSSLKIQFHFIFCRFHVWFIDLFWYLLLNSVIFLFWYANCWLQYLYLVSYYLLFIFTCHISIFVLFFLHPWQKQNWMQRKMKLTQFGWITASFWPDPFMMLEVTLVVFLWKNNRSQHGPNQMQKGEKKKLKSTWAKPNAKRNEMEMEFSNNSCQFLTRPLLHDFF